MQNEDDCGELESPSEGSEEHQFRVKREFVPYRTGKEMSAQVSTALDKLLIFSGYDKRIRPQVKKPNVLVMTFTRSGSEVSQEMLL